MSLVPLLLRIIISKLKGIWGPCYSFCSVLSKLIKSLLNFSIFFFIPKYSTKFGLKINFLSISVYVIMDLLFLWILSPIVYISLSIQLFKQIVLLSNIICSEYPYGYFTKLIKLWIWDCLFKLISDEKTSFQKLFLVFLIMSEIQSFIMIIFLYDMLPFFISYQATNSSNFYWSIAFTSIMVRPPLQYCVWC